MRPILFRYAGEAAENNEEILSEILSINDQLNRTLDRYEEYAKNKIDGKFTTSNQHNSSDILITLDNGNLFYDILFFFFFTVCIESDQCAIHL